MIKIENMNKKSGKVKQSVISKIGKLFFEILMYLITILAVTVILAFAFSQGNLDLKNYSVYFFVTLIVLLLVSIVMFTLWRLIYSLFINVSIFFIALFYNASFILLIIIFKKTFNLDSNWIILITYALITPVTLYIIKILSLLKSKKIMIVTFFYSLGLSILSLMFYNIKIIDHLINLSKKLEINKVTAIIILALYVGSTIALVRTIKKSKDFGSKDTSDKPSIIYDINDKGILRVIWDLLLILFDVKKVTNSKTSEKVEDSDEDNKPSGQPIKKNSESYGIKAVISLAVIISFLITSQAALTTGYYVRNTFVDASQKSIFCIKFVNEEKNPQYVKSNYYMTNGNEIIYSNERWNLSVFKSDNYNLNVINSDSKCEALKE